MTGMIPQNLNNKNNNTIFQNKGENTKPRKLLKVMEFHPWKWNSTMMELLHSFGFKNYILNTCCPIY